MFNHSWDLEITCLEMMQREYGACELPVPVGMIEISYPQTSKVVKAAALQWELVLRHYYDAMFDKETFTEMQDCIDLRIFAEAQRDTLILIAEDLVAEENLVRLKLELWQRCLAFQRGDDLAN